jgi:uncharacterized protein YdhG (YjbR/CyaY superfamily)
LARPLAGRFSNDDFEFKGFTPMDSAKKAPANVDEYIAAFPPDVQARLESLRQTVRAAAPQAQETLSYGMPAFRQKNNLVYFAAAKHHIGFYPTASAIEAFREQLAPYKTSKGAVQFPLDQPLPLDLVTEMVKYRVDQVSKK